MLPPTPILPRIQGYVPEESLLLATEPGFDVDATLDEADFLPARVPNEDLSFASASTPRPVFIDTTSSRYKGRHLTPEIARANLTLDLDSYLPAVSDATLLQDTSLNSITSLPPPLSPEPYSPYARPSSALSWSSTSTAGPSRLALKRTPDVSLEISTKRARTPIEATRHKDDFYSRRMSDASRRASFGTPAFAAVDGDREDLRRMVSRESLRASMSASSAIAVSPAPSVFSIEYGRDLGTPRSEKSAHHALHTPETSIMASPQPSPRHSFELDEVEQEAQSVERSRRMSTPAKAIGFITGLLSRSVSSSSLRLSRSTSLKDLDPPEEIELGDATQPQMETTEPFSALPTAPVLSRPPPQTTINAPPQRHEAPPKPAYPYVAPLTRPLGPKFATDARASRPIQKDAAPRPLAVISQNRVVGTSAFAKAALAKLPPPGKGSSGAGEKVSVKAGEHPKDFGGVRNVWERLAKENKPAGPKRVEKEMKRTVPVQGQTPGKASLARAREREAREAIRRERRAEVDAAKAKR